VFDAAFAGRSERLERQVARIRKVWDEARKADRDHGVLGPAPLQEPSPPLWVGALQPKAIQRALRIGDGFLFGTAGSAVMAEYAPQLREQAAALGKPDHTIAGLAYVGVGDDPKRALEDAAHHVVRYYEQLRTDPANLIHHGPAEKIAQEISEYEAAGLDYLIVFPEIPSLDQVEKLAEGVLPAYR
jgi:alkanesulfonate monooxygenase SsuD/methylene tetrahydromethanopterin reductase-like flavin-dependent oxidoreductase (luciferase family)